jgi:hypothetical protein
MSFLFVVSKSCDNVVSAVLLNLRAIAIWLIYTPDVAVLNSQIKSSALSEYYEAYENGLFKWLLIERGLNLSLYALFNISVNS